MHKATIWLLAAALASAPALAAAKPANAFLKDKIEGDHSEVMLGQMAQQKGASAGVRDFGRMLVDDHRADLDKSTAVAKQMNMTPPTGEMSAAKAEARKLEKLSGASFDREFVRYMINDHEKDIREHRAQAKMKGPTAELARGALPTLEHHLDTAKSLRHGA